MRGRLVGEQERRIEAERTSDRDALLLPARQIVGPVLQPLAEPERFEHLTRAIATGATRIARVPRCDRHVVERVEARDEVERLVHDADRPAPVFGQGLAAQRRDLHVVEADRSARG